MVLLCLLQPCTAIYGGYHMHELGLSLVHTGLPYTGMVGLCVCQCGRELFLYINLANSASLASTLLWTSSAALGCACEAQKHVVFQSSGVR